MSVPAVVVIGDGQLARMMAEPAAALGIELRALVTDSASSTAQVLPFTAQGSPNDTSIIRQLCAGAIALTFEHEHIPTVLFRDLAGQLAIEPSREALLYAQDKLEMRRRLDTIGVPQPRWREVSSMADLEAAGAELGWPLVLKTARGGYDGRGVRVIGAASEATDWLARLSGSTGEGLAGVDAATAAANSAADSENLGLLAEELVSFDQELAVLLARRRSGEIRQWPVAKTYQDHGICSEVSVPAPGLSTGMTTHAQQIAQHIATGLDVTGILAVEMFHVPADPTDPTGHPERVLVNELAMRPHNCGHWTQDGSLTSQFENHLRAVLDLPLGDTAMSAPAAVMVNLLGTPDASSEDEPRENFGEAMAAHPDAKIHYYGKGVRPGRKLGHVNMVGENVEELLAAAREVRDILNRPTS